MLEATTLGGRAWPAATTCLSSRSMSSWACRVSSSSVDAMVGSLKGNLRSRLAQGGSRAAEAGHWGRLLGVCAACCILTTIYQGPSPASIGGQRAEEPEH